MAGKKATKVRPMSTDSFGKSAGGKEFEHPVQNTGASHVYQLDAGESLPPQAEILNKDRAK